MSWEFIASYVHPYNDISYQDKMRIINNFYSFIHPDTHLMDDELMRQDTLIDTLYWCIIIGNGMKLLYNRAKLNVHKEFPQLYMPKYVLTNKDWGLCLSTLTRAYNTVFTIVNITDSTYLGGHDLTGSERDDIFRRSNAFFLTLNDRESLEKDSNIYKKDMQYELNSGGHFYKIPRLYLRGPESKHYRKLNYEEILPFYELRCASRLNDLDALFKNLIDNGCRHIILSLGMFDKNLELDYYTVLRKYKDEFDVIYISIKNMNSNDLLQQLGFVIDVPYTYLPNLNMKPYTNYVRNYALNPSLRLTKAALYNAPKYLLNTIGNTYKYMNKGAMTYVPRRNRYYGGKRRKTFKRKNK
jgi:hypothetical protein